MGLISGESSQTGGAELQSSIKRKINNLLHNLTLFPTYIKNRESGDLKMCLVEICSVKDYNFFPRDLLSLCSNSL